MEAVDNAHHVERWTIATNALRGMIRNLVLLMRTYFLNGATWISSNRPPIRITYTLETCVGDEGEWSAEECSAMREALQIHRHSSRQAPRQTSLRVTYKTRDTAYKSIWGDPPVHTTYCSNCSGSGVFLNMTAGDITHTLTTAPQHKLYWDSYALGDIESLQKIERWPDITGSWDYSNPRNNPSEEQIEAEQAQLSPIIEALDNYYKDFCDTLAAATPPINVISETLINRSYHLQTVPRRSSYAYILRMIAFRLCNPNPPPALDILDVLKVYATPGGGDGHFYELGIDL